MEDLINMQEELSNPGYVFPVIEARAFVDHLLPPLKDGVNVRDIRSTLKKRGYVDSSGRWKGLWTMSGSKRRKKYDVFAPLLDIFEKAASVAAMKTSRLNQILEMVLLPERSNGRRRSASSQNACFAYKRRGVRSVAASTEKCTISSWSQIALAASFKRTSSEESRKKNARRIISDTQLAMARDPCRRFTFGMTVENTTIRLWFCSRASPVVSKPFDFSKDLDTLLYVFLSLAFATKNELGWDPTMRPFIKNDGRRVYHIDVDGETYETNQVLSKSPADQLVGHATRVWKVHRLDSDVPYVLKDVWIEEDQRPEHATYEMLLHDIQERYGSEVLSEVASHFLTPVVHCVVCLDDEVDHTTEVMMRGYTPSFKEQYRVNVENLGNGDDSDGENEDKDSLMPSTEIGIVGSERNGLRDPFHWYNPVRRVPRLKHYRVVFKEVAKPLSDVRDLADVFTVLSDSAKVLKWIHGAGWVHRDLSVGNLYFYDGRGLIGDFEYAKCKNSDVEHEELTGTRDFVAVEAAERRYAHLPPIDRSRMDARLRALEEERWEDLAFLQDYGRPPPFFHNDLHDLESLWWIAIWKIFSYYTDFRADLTDDFGKEWNKQRELANSTLFPRSSETTSRRLFLQTNVHYWELLAWFPDHLRTVKRILAALRSLLVKKYSKFEAGFPSIQMHLFEGTHEQFQDLFKRCRECIDNAKLVSCQKFDLDQQLLNQKDDRTAPQTLRTGGLGLQVECVRLNAPYHHSPSGPECVICFPRKGKRKRDNNDVVSVRLARITRPEISARYQKREVTRQVPFPGSNEIAKRESFLRALDEAREQLVHSRTRFIDLMLQAL
ncbi:hypothetical protein ACEPAF_9250 [Sanghuangporus sanghuang]